VLDCAERRRVRARTAAFRAAGADGDGAARGADGRNINDACGSTASRRLQAAVRESGADIGLALDGDADRVIAVDEQGGSSTAIRS
jgi:phosphoglucosamine mutase